MWNKIERKILCKAPGKRPRWDAGPIQASGDAVKLREQKRSAAKHSEIVGRVVDDARVGADLPDQFDESDAQSGFDDDSSRIAHPA